MIKKSVFENDLIVGMQKELRKQASAEQPNLVKAGECLHAAMEILEEAGFQKRADQVLRIMHKIAAGSTKQMRGMPTIHQLIDAGVTPQDLQEFVTGSEKAKVKVNLALRAMGFDSQDITRFIGKHNVIPEHELKTYEKLTSWMQHPFQPEPNQEIGPGQEISMESLPRLPEDDEGTPSGEELSFQSLAGKSRKPRRPDTIHPGQPHNGHTKNLTPQRMIENLTDHGTVFNMASDGLDINNAAFDPELAEVLGADTADALSADDIFDVDIGQPPEFGDDWSTWKHMQGEDEEAPPTVRPGSRPPEGDSQVEGLDLLDEERAFYNSLPNHIRDGLQQLPKDQFLGQLQKLYMADLKGSNLSVPKINDWHEDEHGDKINRSVVNHVNKIPAPDFDNLSQISLDDITDADDDMFADADQVLLEDFEDEVHTADDQAAKMHGKSYYVVDTKTREIMGGPYTTYDKADGHAKKSGGSVSTLSDKEAKDTVLGTL